MPSTFEIVTEQIIRQLESGVAPWQKPWKTEAPKNLMSQKEYQGLNVFLLMAHGYGSPYWLTFNQANRLGGHIRKGEKGQCVVFWKISDYKKTELNPDTQELESKDSKSILLRYYTVFNLEQSEGIADKLGLTSVVRQPSLGDCEKIIAEMPNQPNYEQHSQAFYRPSADIVGMPSKTAFHSSEAYYATMFHELTHSTGHPTRCSRFDLSAPMAKFGSDSYSREELIAEMGSAMLCGQSGIAPATVGNSASYLQSWINVLKGDSRLAVIAASAAQKAANYILGKTNNDKE